MTVRELAKSANWVLAGRLVILTNYPAGVLAREAEGWVAAGASGVFVLSVGGTERDADGYQCFVLPAPEAGDLFTQLHAQDRLLADLPVEAVQALERFDPRSEAVVVAGSWTSISEVAGRRVVGSRRRSWAALEDKTLSDELVRQAGFEPPPSVVVPAGGGDCLKAARELDRGQGTVWAGDASRGVNGNGDLVRFVDTTDSVRARSAADLFASRCERVRVAPFLSGVPSSIHGLVFPSKTMVFAPLEVLSLRRDDGTFFNAGTANVWDASPSIEARMREIARAVGDLLRAQFDYRGAFGIDGIATAQGFAVTEINTRLSAGFATLGQAIPQMPFRRLDLALREDHPLPSIDGIEDEVSGTLKTSRVAHAYSIWSGGHFTTHATTSFVGREAGFRLKTDQDGPEVLAETAPSPGTGLISLTFQPGTYSEGAPLAPSVAQMLRLTDRHCGTKIGAARPAWE